VLVDKHTLYPFYSAFLPIKEATKVKQFMIGDKGGSIYNKAGLMASAVSLNQYFKFCPQCIKVNMEQYGELYWHRIHQIPGVLVCPKHQVPLYDSQVIVRGFNKHEYRIPSSDVCRANSEALNYSDKVLEQLINLSEDADYLLNHRFPNRPLEWFREQYMNRLKELGYANINANVKQKELLTDFVDYYGDKLLIMLQSPVNINSEYNWLSELLRKKSKTTHPIRHLLLANFLNISIEDLFYHKSEYNPFGEGHWPCLNPAAEHYKALLVQDIQIKYGNDSKSPLGIFNCSCGFSYMRNGPDTSESDKYKFTKILAFGPVWETRLKELVEKRLSLRETARLLQADPGTVKKYAKRLGMKTYWQERSQIKEISIDNNHNSGIEIISPQEHRQKWLDLLNRYPEISKTELRRKNAALYTWLYRNDREWLDRNSPQLKATVNIISRVDWEQRDDEIFNEVKEAVTAMLTMDMKPKRITISAVGSSIGIRPLLEKHLDKLPKTKAYLEEHKESISHYQIRRIHWAIQELQKEGQELQLWRISRLAGLSEEYQKNLEQTICELIQDK
ncbi:MAG: transposase, partial [Clostridiales bacterium]|nr:transposase [Clostridiales bacterium]